MNHSLNSQLKQLVETYFTVSTIALFQKPSSCKCSGSWRVFSRITRLFASLRQKATHLPSEEQSDIASVASDCFRNPPDPTPNISVDNSTVQAAAAPIQRDLSASAKVKENCPQFSVILKSLASIQRFWESDWICWNSVKFNLYVDYRIN